MEVSMEPSKKGRRRRVKAIYHPVYRRMIGRLTAARKKRGLTQDAVAKVIGVHRQWVSKIEICELTCDVITLIRLCRLYRIRPADLVGWMERKLPTVGTFFSLLRDLLAATCARVSHFQTCSILRSRRARSWAYPMGQSGRSKFAPIAAIVV